jgi:hypothetical protein
MTGFNKHGLSRYIPADIRRQVRQHSKFGCVICRRGFYQYEHIDPPFEEATEHDPERICCLCGACHDSVTRGQLSKQAIYAAYRKVQDLPLEKVGPPVGPLDFNNGNAELQIGGLLYSPAVQTVLRYNGLDLIHVLPSERANEPGRISAVFTDGSGDEVLRLEENEWVGSLNNWDIEIVGRQITVRRKKGSVTLRLRLDPPGRVVVERLDMRIFDSHILVTEQAYAVGRYITDGSVHWVYANIHIHRSSPLGVAIEFTDPVVLEERDLRFRDTGQELSAIDRRVVMNSNAGILIKPLGVAIAGLCGSFDLAELAIGNRNLADMRKIILSHPEQIGRFISTGEIIE